jgi:hypothetical protein
MFRVARRLKRGINRVEPSTANLGTVMNSEAKIYVADLAAYNSGILNGVWIEDLVDLDLINEKVSAMLASSPVANAEEYAIHDYEGFGCFNFSEFASLSSVNQIALFLNEYPDWNKRGRSRFKFTMLFVQLGRKDKSKGHKTKRLKARGGFDVGDY